jgi:hypothetical protein
MGRGKGLAKGIINQAGGVQNFLAAGLFTDCLISIYDAISGMITLLCSHVLSLENELCGGEYCEAVMLNVVGSAANSRL